MVCVIQCRHHEYISAHSFLAGCLRFLLKRRFGGVFRVLNLKVVGFLLAVDWVLVCIIPCRHQDYVSALSFLADCLQFLSKRRFGGVFRVLNHKSCRVLDKILVYVALQVKFTDPWPAPERCVVKRPRLPSRTRRRNRRGALTRGNSTTAGL